MGARKSIERCDAGIQLLRIDELEFKTNPEVVYQRIKEFLGAENV